MSLSTFEYDRAAAVRYAETWALSRNPQYYNFDGLGGDCTNFASQCIYAGCKTANYTPVTGWYYNSLSSRAPAWTGVEFLHKFLINNKSVGPFATEVSQSQIVPGDIIQLADSTGHYYHSLVVVSTEGQIYVATHTFDALYRPFSSYSYARARFMHIGGYRKYT